MLCAFILLFYFTAVSQSVVIIASGGAGFTQLEPTPFSNSYSVTASNIPSGVTPTYQWVATGGTITLGSTSQACTVQWNNTPDNTSAKSIKINYTYTSGSTPTTLTDTKTITVKHIGTIGNIAINGTNVSNGGTFSNLPCGTGSITVASAVPATFPNSSVIYTWTLPSGWTTANTTTTTNSISVTPNLSGAGSVSVSARRSDGTTTQSASITVTRPTVASTAPTISSFGTAQGTLTGVRLLCSNTTFTNSASANATEYRWTTTG